MFSEWSNSLDPLLNIKHSFLQYPVVHGHILHTQGLCCRLPHPLSVCSSVNHSLLNVTQRYNRHPIYAQCKHYEILHIPSGHKTSISSVNNVIFICAKALLLPMLSVLLEVVYAWVGTFDLSPPDLVKFIYLTKSGFVLGLLSGVRLVERFYSLLVSN